MLEVEKALSDGRTRLPHFTEEATEAKIGEVAYLMLQKEFVYKNRGRRSWETTVTCNVRLHIFITL